VQSALRDVYRRYAELARGDSASGRTRLPEAFRAEALVAQAGYDVTLIDEVKRVEDQRLRALLALPSTTPLGDPADAPPPALAVDVDALARRAVEHNQELRAAGVEVEAAGVGARLARWAYAPTFALGGGPMINDDFDSSSGRRSDSTVVTFGLTLPIWYGAREAGVREADAKVRAARAAEAGERERVVADVARAAFRVRNASRLAELYGRELVPQAEAALLRSQSMVKEGTESLASSLELAATWQQLRIAELRAVADETQAVAALERLLGTSLEAAPAER
jgi:outer membrane protein TolC